MKTRLIQFFTYSET